MSSELKNSVLPVCPFAPLHSENLGPSSSPSDIVSALRLACEKESYELVQRAFSWALPFIQNNEQMLRNASAQTPDEWWTIKLEGSCSLDWREVGGQLEFLIHLTNIGEGSYNIVDKTLWVTESGRSSLYAVSRPNDEGYNVDDRLKKMIRETQIFSELYEDVQPRSSCYLFVDRSSGTPEPRALSPCFEQSLYDYIEDSGPLSVDDAIKIGHKLADDLARLHAGGRCHYDIKTDNVCLDGNKIPFFIDFDPAPRIGSSTTTGDGQYEAPEVIEALGPMIAFGKADVWSLGMLFLEMRSPSLLHQLDYALSNLRGRKRGVFDIKYAAIQEQLLQSLEPLDRLIACMLKVNPNERVSSKKVAQELAGMDKNGVNVDIIGGSIR